MSRPPSEATRRAISTPSPQGAARPMEGAKIQIAWFDTARLHAPCALTRSVGSPPRVRCGPSVKDCAATRGLASVLPSAEWRRRSGAGRFNDPLSPRWRKQMLKRPEVSAGPHNGRSNPLKACRASRSMRQVTKTSGSSEARRRSTVVQRRRRSDRHRRARRRLTHRLRAGKMGIATLATAVWLTLLGTNYPPQERCCGCRPGAYSSGGCSSPYFCSRR